MKTATLTSAVKDKPRVGLCSIPKAAEFLDVSRGKLYCMVNTGEALHTLGAAECYDPVDPYARFPLCTDPRCLMQFEPNPANCGDGFPMCSRVIAHIRKALTD